MISLPWMHVFWENWKAGLPFGQAVREAYEATKGNWEFLYKAFDSLNIVIETGKTATDLIAGGAAAVDGDQALTIADLPLALGSGPLGVMRF
jgi:hypothetical protein